MYSTLISASKRDKRPERAERTIPSASPWKEIILNFYVLLKVQLYIVYHLVLLLIHFIRDLLKKLYLSFYYSCCSQTERLCTVAADGDLFVNRKCVDAFVQRFAWRASNSTKTCTNEEIGHGKSYD